MSESVLTIELRGKNSYKIIKVYQLDILCYNCNSFL